jgi:CRP/FNR family transcriptional regulator
MLQRLLEQASFFNGISIENREALAAICTSRELARKEILFLEGATGLSVFLLASGAIQLFKTSPEGKEVVIKLIKPGELFAEVILFERVSYPVSAIAVRVSRVYEIPRADFLRLLDDNGFRDDFIGVLMRKQRYLVDQILSLSSDDAAERLFRFFDAQYGRKLIYKEMPSKKDIAAVIGISPETLSRLLLKLKEERILTWKKDRVEFAPDFWETRLS